MNVLEKIDRGEITVSVGINNQNMEWEDTKNALEFLRLARLGAAAEKGFDQDGMFPCGKVYGGHKCTGDSGAWRCVWQDFCRIRAEKGAE